MRAPASQAESRMQAHARREKQAIIESFLAWLRYGGRWRDGEAIAAFAMQVTGEGTRPFHGHDADGIVALLGARANGALDETQDCAADT
jgi:hypothetical protein